MSGMTGNNEKLGTIKDGVQFLGLSIIESALNDRDMQWLTSKRPGNKQRLTFWLDCAGMSKSDLNRAIANRFPRSTRRCA